MKVIRHAHPRAVSPRVSFPDSSSGGSASDDSSQKLDVRDGRDRRRSAKRYRRHSAALLGALALAAFVAACAPGKSKEKKTLELPSVSVTMPAERSVSDAFSIIGSIQAENEVTVLSETSGKIVAMPAKTGAVVLADTPLVFVDKDLREAAFIAAEAAYKKAAKDAERAAELSSGKLISDADMEQARLGEASARSQYLVAKKELENTTIRSTIGGTIAETYVNLGEQIGQGARIALVVDTSRLKVRVLLPERSAIAQRKGDQVVIESDLFPGRVFTGSIESVSVRGDETHSFPTEVALSGAAASELRAGMSVRLEFGGRGERKALVIPRVAIVGSLRDPEVFVVAQGAAQKRKIVIGGEYGTDVEVRSGLEEKDAVVTSGQTLLAEGQAVKIVDTGAGHDAD
jgi:RND family efflux transporter MFP subunit